MAGATLKTFLADLLDKEGPGFSLSPFVALVPAYPTQAAESPSTYMVAWASFGVAISDMAVLMAGNVTRKSALV